MLKKYTAGLMAAMLIFTPMAAVAQTAMAAVAQTAISTDGLSEQQIAELNLKAAELKNQPAPQSTASKVNEWVEVGQGIGAGLASAARETGTVVNEFAMTPVGKLVTIMIIWKVMGEDIVGVLVGVPLLIVVISLTVWTIRSVLHVPMVKHYENGKVVRKEPHEDYDNELTESGMVIILFSAVVGFFGSVWIIAGMIL